MNYIQLIQMLLQFGVPFAQKVIADLEAGKGQTTVSAADAQAIIALAQESSASIWQREGIALPPKV